MNSTVFSAVSAVLAAAGGATLIVIALSGWLGRVIANRIAQQDRARVDAEIERLRASLSRDTGAELDALNRRRGIYARLATGLRVFLDSGPDPAESKRRFLEAYDEGCVWAAEPVIRAVEDLLKIMQRPPLDQDHVKAAYRRCILEMRRDSGFPDTAVEYQFVSFGR